MSGSPPASSLRAPQIAGALLCTLLAFFLGACKEDRTPTWGTQDPPASPSEQVKPPEKKPDNPSTPTEAGELRFLSYNLKNYLTMSRYVDGKRIDRGKPETEIVPLVELIVEAKPDVVGLCEIGTLKDLRDLQGRLKEAGLDLPHHEHAGGEDKVRRLALLSRHPIAATNSQGAGGTLKYQSVDGEGKPTTFAMQRGILDATVEVKGQKIRFLGVHLKSKRPIPQGKQDLMRRHEAYLLRKHADDILAKTPNTLLCVYGDFNDTRRESPVRAIQGPYNSERYLEPLSHKDSRGEVWTHFWSYQHVYSRFDYALASKKLRPLFQEKESYLIDDPKWSKASDHRALMTVFRWK